MMEKAKPLPMMMASSVKMFRDQQQYVFDTLWNRAMPVEQKIREIEEGIEPEFVKVINDGEKVGRLLLSLSRPATSMPASNTATTLRLSVRYSTSIH